MSDQVVSILVFIVVFLIATVLPQVHMGALALVAAFLVGSFLVGDTIATEDDSAVDVVLGGFPGNLFVILVGVTYLFAIARANGTVDWLVNIAVRGVGGRIALLPWVMFLVTAVLTAFGAVVPAAVAIVAPVGLGFAKRYGINPLLMGLLIVNGATAGGFSPISIFGGIVNGVVQENNLPGNPVLLFVSSFLFNAILSVAVYLLFGGRKLLREGGRVDTTGAVEEEERALAASIAAGGSGAAGPTNTTTEYDVDGEPIERAPSGGVPGSAGGGARGTGGTAGGDRVGTAPVTTLDRNRILTLVGILALAVGALFFDLDVGFLSLTVAVLLTLTMPAALTKNAVGQIAWREVLLICGIVTYVSLLQEIETVDYLGEAVTNIGAPLLVALIICLIGAVVSAFASTTGILGALIPLAVPFLLTGQISAVALIIALSISSSVVDSSPFSTSGALAVANSPEDQRDYVFRGLQRWGFSMIVIAPLVAWLIFVVPGWL